MAKLIDLIVSGKSSFANDISAKTIYSTRLYMSGAISTCNTPGSWVSGMTNAAIRYNDNAAMSTSSYHPFLSMKSSGGHVVNFGGLGNTIGFYGYYNGRTANSYDWSFTVNSSTGKWSMSNSITASAFITSGGANTQVVRGDGTLQNINSLSVSYANSAGNADTVDGYHASAFATAGHTHSYLPLSGGTLTGPVEIKSTSSGNYNEGLRISVASNNWAGITFGSTGLSGAPTNGWFAALNPSDQFIISPNNSSNTTGLTLNAGGDAKWRNNTIWHAGNDGSGSGLDADTVDGYHIGDLDSRYARTGYSFISPSDNSMTGSTDLQDWVTNMYNQGGYKGYSSITVGSWWWVRSLDFSSPVGTIRTSGAMIIYSGDGNSNKNYKHFLVLDAYADLYGITSNEESWKYYSRFLNDRNYTDYTYSKTEADNRFVNVAGDTMTGNLKINATPSQSDPPLQICYTSSYTATEQSIGLIKFGSPTYDAYLGIAPATKTVFGKVGYFYHIGSSYEYDWMSSSWSKLMALECSTGDLWVKSRIAINSSPKYPLTATGAGDIIQINSTSGSYTCINYTLSGYTAWSAGITNENKFYFWNNNQGRHVVDINQTGRVDIITSETQNNSLKLLSNGPESSICFADRSGSYTTWTVGRGPGAIGNTYGWWNGSRNAMTLTNTGLLSVIGNASTTNGIFISQYGSYNYHPCITDNAGRPGISISGNYPYLWLTGGGASNSSHGATITLCAPDTAAGTNGNYKMWTFGVPGQGATWMDLAYSSNYANPHNGINSWSGGGVSHRIMRWRVSPQNQVLIYGTGTNMAASLEVNSSRTGSWVYGGSFLGPNLNTGDNIWVNIGKANSTRNSFGLSWHHAGGDGSTSNYGAIEIFSVGNAQRWYGDLHTQFLGRVDVANIGYSSYNYNSAAMQIREYGYGGSQTDTWGYAPRLAWHWSGRVAAQIGLASNGYLYTAPCTGTTFYKLVYESGTWGINITGSAGSIAWGNVSGKPSTFTPSTHYHGLSHSDFHISVPSQNTDLTWKASFGMNMNAKWLFSYRTNATSPSWMGYSWSSGIAFGGSDTKAAMSVNYSSPSIRFAAGSGTSDTAAPTWSMSINGVNGGNYNLSSFLTSQDIPSSLPANGGNADSVDSQHFSYSNSSNSPTYLWATNSNGSSFLAARASMSVNYATSAGNADTVDGQHFNWNNDRNDHTYLWAASSNGQAYLVHRASMSVNYASSAGSSSTVTVNSSDANSTYRMVWHSGNTLYSTAGIYCNPSTDYLYATSVQTSDWFRSSGNSGWYSQTHGGGWYMNDTTYIRVYGSKRVYNDNTSQYAFYTSGGMTALGHMYSNSSACSWIAGQNATNAALNIGDATDTGSYWPWFRQTNTSSKKWFSVGTLNNSLYFIGSATSRTANSYDYGFRMDFSDGYMYGNFSGYLSGRAAEVTVNNSDSNSTYRMVWHSGNTLYGTGGIYCNPSTDTLYASAFYETSDVRLKQNIKHILASNNIPQIKEFDWKNSGKHSYGLIAQELESMGYSELVDTKDDGYKSVNYTAALCLIIGKLQLKIKELEDKIKSS